MLFNEKTNWKGWKKNIELCVDVKTYLKNDLRMKAEKGYQGVLTRHVVCEDFKYNEYMTFVETANQKRVKRNPKLFNGRYISLSMSDNGSPRLNFKKLRMGPRFSPERYALAVYNELLWALECLVERR